MPVVSVTLEDTNRSILSPTYYKIVEDIVERINIPFGTLIILHKDNEITKTDNNANTSINNRDNLPSTVSKRRIYANIVEDYNEDELTCTPVHQRSSYPIFQDNEISVSVYPVYVKSNIEIEFSYISPSKIEANRLRDEIRLRLSQTRNIDIHEIEYSILLPDIIEEFIVDIYDLKNRLVPQSLETYFREHTTKRVYPITDLSNKDNVKLAIHEKQIRIVGVFDFSSMPENIDIDNENNNYKLSFKYKLSLDVPRMMVMRYPVMVCNRPLPTKYLSFIQEHKRKSKEEDNRNLNYTSESLYNLSTFEAHRQLENRVDIKLPFNVPAFDDFTTRQGHAGYGTLVSFLTDVEETECKFLFNLKDISPYYIPDNILEYIKNNELNYITAPYSSFIYLGLHQEDAFFDADVLKVDSDFNVFSRRKLSLLKPVRVTLSFCLDIAMLNEQVMLRLREEPEILLNFIKEYIFVLNNFKTEAVNHLIDNNFYRTIMELFVYYLNKDMNYVVCGLLQILYEDSYLRNVFMKNLFIGYPNLYAELNKKGLIEINDRTFDVVSICGNVYNRKSLLNHLNKKPIINESIRKGYRFDYEKPGMKTLMLTGVVAYRREDLEN